MKEWINLISDTVDQHTGALSLHGTLIALLLVWNICLTIGLFVIADSFARKSKREP